MISEVNELKRIALDIKNTKPSKQDFLKNEKGFRLVGFDEHTEEYRRVVFTSNGKIQLKTSLSVWFGEDGEFNGIDFRTQV